MAPVQDTSDVDRLKQEALALAAKPTKSFHAFARTLWEAHEQDRGFIREVEQISGIKRRALFYMLAVGRLIAEYHITEEQAERVGWTKLQIIADHAQNQAEKLSQHVMAANLHLALRTTANALPEALRQQGTSGEKYRTLLFRLSADQYAHVEAALMAFGAGRKGRGLTDKEEALVRLALSYPTSTQ